MRKSTLLLSLALLCSVGWSGWLWRELRAERARHAELATRSNAQPSLATPSPPSTPPAAVTIPAALPAAAVQPASPPQRVAQQVEPDPQSHERQMLQQPKYREAWRAQQRLNYARRRDNLVRLLDLTPEEADAAIEVAIDRQLAWMDRTVQKPMTEEYRQSMQALAEQDKREDEARLRELLGEEKFASYQQYMDSRQTRVQIDELRPQFTGADMLRDEQVEPLIAALHVERTRMQQALQEYYQSVNRDDPQFGEVSNNRQIELLRDTYERMHSAAAPILSTTQLARLDVLLKRDLARRESEVRMNHIQSATD